MDTYTPDRREEDWEAYRDEPEAPLPRRVRRQFFNRRTAALGALVTYAIGFYAGIRVEKGQVSSSSSTASLGSGAAARVRAAARAGGAGVSFDTVSSVNGKTLYVTDTSGNTVKVRLSPSTKITKTQSVGRKAIRPGDTIIVTGAQGSGGTTTAASVTDSGNRTSASGRSGLGGSGLGGSGSGGSGSGSGSSSAVGSLFSSGG